MARSILRGRPGGPSTAPPRTPGGCSARPATSVHGTTHERPLTRFVETESEFMRPLPSRPPELAVWARVKLHPDCHVQFEKAYYSASFRLVRQRLWLRATETTVQLFRDHEFVVATHPRWFRPGSRSTIDEYLPPEALAYKLRGPQPASERRHRGGLSRPRRAAVCSPRPGQPAGPARRHRARPRFGAPRPYRLRGRGVAARASVLPTA